jgi:anti-anti-sigma regulatory factor
VGRDRVRRVDAGDQVTVLDVYGSLLYTESRTLQARLPSTAGSHAPAVVLRLRGRTSLGATFLKVTAGYAERLAEVGGCLYLSGLDPHLRPLTSVNRKRPVQRLLLNPVGSSSGRVIQKMISQIPPS